MKCIENVIGAYTDYDAFMALAKVPTLEYVVSNTTEAGIVYDAGNRYEDCPPATRSARSGSFRGSCTARTPARCLCCRSAVRTIRSR